MKNIISFIQTHKTVIIINDSDYIGDSVIFFWPFINTLECHCLDSKLLIFHNHKNQFKPANDSTLSYNIKLFYKMSFSLKETLVIAFTSKFGRLKKYLERNDFKSIIKDFVGLNFITLNISVIFKNLNQIEFEIKENMEYDYSMKIKNIHSDSGFPMLNQHFSNVYEYSKICITNFLDLDSFIMAHEGNIHFREISLNDSWSDMTLTKVSNVNSNYILINLIAGSLKADVLDKYLSLLNWIEQLSVKFNNYNVFILSDSNFSQLRFDIDNSFNNIYFLKDDIFEFWNALIFKANKVYSIDTGFLHIAHILNKNTFGFWGEVDFWFFKHKIIKI